MQKQFSQLAEEMAEMVCDKYCKKITEPQAEEDAVEMCAQCEFCQKLQEMKAEYERLDNFEKSQVKKLLIQNSTFEKQVEQLEAEIQMLKGVLLPAT